MKLALIGYGKMGKAIEEIARDAGHEIVLIVDQDNTDAVYSDKLKQAEVAIEFTEPESAVKNILACLKAGVPVVSGTTGWLDEWATVQKHIVEEDGAFFYASNFSIGVNILFALNRYLAGLMSNQKQYEVRLEETHHTEKLDAPSGTAITLAQGILANLSHKEDWVKGESHSPAEIPVISHRIENVTGTHRVDYTSAIDSIEIKHTAHSREGFVRGALMAAKWLIGRKGSYGMPDLLGFG